MSGGLLYEPRAHRAASRSARTWVVALMIAGAGLAASGAVLHLVGGRDGGDGHQLTATPSTTAPVASRAAAGGTAATRHWLAVLEAIDRRRADAWRLGDASLLKRVYQSGSPELIEDQTMLAGYRHRGLTVSRVDMRFLSVQVRERRPEDVSLIVVDRLGPAVAHDAAGPRQELPRDLPTRHEIELHRVGGEWRIARITVV